jgi:signal transduction histidine kinase
MTILPVHFKMQKRIGYVLFGASIVIALLNVGLLVGNPEPEYLSWIGLNVRVFNAIVDTVIGVIVLSLSLIDHPVVRMLQVAAFAGAGLVFNLTNEPWETAGVALIVYAIILAIQYSFFERRFTLKMVIALAIIFGARVIRTMAFGKIDFLGSLGMVTAIAAFFLLLWIAFSDVLKELADKANDLELEQRKDSVFVRFGRNVAGLVHNLSNMLSVLYSINALMRQRALSADMAEFVARQQNAFDRMTGTLERILAVVRAKQDTSICAVDLNVLLSGVVEYYRTDFDFKNSIRVDMKPCEGKLIVEAQPLELCEVVENLIKNSWESMKGGNVDGPKIIEIKSFRQPAPGFSIRDHGCGIPGLENCRDDECRRHFHVGRTTKEKGTGLGVPFILEAVKSNGWSISMESELARGTETTIFFGKNAADA